MMSFYPNDRRKMKRMLIDQAVVCYVDQLNNGATPDHLEAITSRSIDLCEKGVSLITEHILPVKTKVKIKFMDNDSLFKETPLRTIKEYITFSGEVSYNIPAQSGSFRMGIVFTESKERLEEKFFKLICTQY